MNGPRIVLINGPAGVGKDTLASLLQAKYGGVIDRMSAPLKAAYLCLCPGADLVDRVEKEAHRANLIGLSESYAKPAFGADVFGRLLTSRAKKHDGIVWVPDSRFPEEARAVVVELGEARTAIIRVHRKDRRAIADSGGYLDETLGVPIWDVHNDGAPEDMLDQLEGFHSWIVP